MGTYQEFMNINFKSSFLKSSGIYTLTNILNKSIPFLLLPILTRYLSPEEFGVVAMVNVLIGITTPFIGLNVQGAITRKYYDTNSVDLPAYITNCLYILLTTTLLVTILYLLFQNIIYTYTEIPVRWFWVIILMSLAQCLTQINLTLWIAQVKPIRFGTFEISQTILKFILALIFVVILGFGWKGQILSQAISLFIFAIVGIIFLYKDSWLRFDFKLNYIKHALKFGIPLIPHALSGFLISMTDRIFITNMVGINETGLYVVGYQIGMIVNVIAESFQRAWTPWLFNVLKSGNLNDKEQAVKMTYVYIFGLILFGLVLFLVSPLLIGTIIGSKYSNSLQFVFWVAIGYSFNGIYRVFVDYIFYVEKTYYLATITFIVAILNIILNYFMIKYWGAIGAAIATSIIYLFKALLVVILATKLYRMPWLLNFQRKL